MIASANISVNRCSIALVGNLAKGNTVEFFSKTIDNVKN